MPVLLESCYGQAIDTSAYPALVCIAGGAGITAVTPYLRRHAGAKKLFWGVRGEGIVEECEGLLAGVEKEVFVRERMDLRRVVDEGVASAGGEGVVFVVCGPCGMADEVRMAVAAAGRHGSKVKLVEEVFGW